MRRIVVGTVVGVTVAVVPALPARAGGGGGCYEPLTEATGTVVAMRNYCFRPAILYVGRGDPVTWVNRDEAPHVVIGANDVFGRYRGYELGETTTFSFRKPGVYPYLCSYHPGMAGAVVVGNVDRPAASVERLIRPGASSGVSAPEARPAPPTIQRIFIRRQAEPSPSPWRAVAAGAAGLLLLLVVGTAGLRRRLREDDRA